MKDTDWKKKLTPEQYKVLREKATEPAFTGKYYHHDADGIYRCAGCGQELFTSESKYDSGSGWPSFFTPMAGDRVRLQPDDSHGMHRTEVVCARCGGHLGHVFEDGPQQHGGKRFCINSAALDFKGKEKK